MKILLTVHQFFPQYASGTEVLTYSVAKELIKRGHTVHVLTGHPSDKDLREADRLDEYDYDDIHIYRFHHAYTPMGGQTSLIELGYDNRLAATFFEKIIKQFKPDVLHFFHLNRLGTGLIDQAVRANIPAFMTPTDFWAICPTGQLVFYDGEICNGPDVHAGNCVKHLAYNKTKGLVKSAIKLLPAVSIDWLVRLSQADVLPNYPHRIEVKAVGSRLAKNIARLNQLKKIISPSHLMTHKLLQYGVLPELIVQSPFGIDLPVVESTPYLRESHHKPLRIGFIGSLARHKGCHVLIEAFKTLPQGHAILNIYGNMDELPEYVAQLKNLADQQDAIRFCGAFPNSQIGEVLAGMDVLVVPSLWYENTPLVVYSAQAARCPVVASDFPGISEVIQEGVNGLLFEAGNVSALTKQLTRLIDEVELVTKLSTNYKQPKSITSYVDELLTVWGGGKG